MKKVLLASVSLTAVGMIDAAYGDALSPIGQAACDPNKTTLVATPNLGTDFITRFIIFGNYANTGGRSVQ